jgi:hypothetical protein
MYPRSAETVTRVADTAVPDADFKAASAVFSEKELADLTIAELHQRAGREFERAEVSLERILRELAAIAFSNISKAVTLGAERPGPRRERRRRSAREGCHQRCFTGPQGQAG